MVIDFLNTDTKPWEQEFIENEKGQKYPKPENDISMDSQAFVDASIIIPDNVIIVDIDNGISKSELDKLLKTFNIETYYTITKRGFHLYYERVKYQKITQKQGITPLGISVELKDKKNHYVCEKIDGNLRESNDLSIAPFPKLLKLLKYNNLTELYNMSEGSRDNCLFQHSGALIAIKYSEYEIRQILNYINLNFFEEPLHDIEKFCTMERIKENQKADLIDLANEAMADFDACNVDGVLNIKIKDVYINKAIEVKQAIAKKYDRLLSSQIEELYKQMTLKAHLVDVTSYPVILKDGHINKGVYYPFLYDGYTPFKINTAYNPSAEVNETVEQLFQHFTNGDEEYRKLLIQILAYPLIYDHDYKRHNPIVIFFVGQGKNGKGTMLKLIQKLYDRNNVSNKTIQDLVDDQHSIRAMKDKLVNTGDDIEEGYIKPRAMKLLKSITTVDYISTRGLYQESSDNIIAPTLIFTSNHILKSTEKGLSWARRVKWLPVFNVVEKPDRKFISKLTSKEALEYTMKLCIEALPDLIENGFTECKVVDEFTMEYHETNNNVIMFIKSYQKDEFEKAFIDRKPKFAYDEYSEYCYDEGEKTLALKTFRQTVLTELNWEIKGKWVDGKTQRVFSKK